MTLTARIR